MDGEHPESISGDAGQIAFNRRAFLRTVGSSTVGVSILSGTATANGANIALKSQTARTDGVDGDDFPVPDAYIVELPRVKFEDDTGTIALPVKNSDGESGVSADDTFWYEATNNAPAFVVGVHSPDVGNGKADSLSSLIGVRPFRPGKYNNEKIPVWAGPPPWQRKLGARRGQYPADETIEVTATIWYGPDVFPPIAPRDSSKAIAQTPEDETNGPVRDNRGLISNSAKVTFPPRS